MASYRKRTNGWEVTIELGINSSNGKRLRKVKGGFRTKKEAEQYGNKLSVDISKGLNVVDNKIRFEDFLNDWFYKYKIKTLSINTTNSYRTRMDNHIIPYLGNKELDKINTAIIQEFYYHLINKKLKAETAKKVMDILNGVFKYAKKLNLIRVLPTDIEKFSCEKPKMLVWSEEQLKEFIVNVKDKYIYIPVMIAALTGVRVGELCGLRWSNVELENGVIHIKEQVIHDRKLNELIHTDVLKSKASYRSISIPRSLVEILKEHRNNTLFNMTDFVIINSEGSMCNPRNVSMNFTKKVKKYNHLPQISIHGLRHTHATILLLKGENVKVISDRLGHESVKTTLDKYSHVLPSMKIQTANLLEEVFF